MFDEEEKDDEWSIWRIKNRPLRMLVAWVLVCIVLPPVIVCIIIYELVKACLDETVNERKGSLSLFLVQLRMGFSPDLWHDIWKAMTSWKEYR